MIRILHLIWFAIVAASMLYAALTGGIQQVLPALMNGCENAISLTLRLGAGYLLFCGLMEIARDSGAAGMLERLIRPLMKRLMPSAQEEKIGQAAAVNLSMNLLGMGNAATPMGMEAVRLMDARARQKPEVRHDLYMLLILNATSIQLLPTTVLALRTAAGSADANAVLTPTLLCTATSTVVGAGLGMLCRIWREKR